MVQLHHTTDAAERQSQMQRLVELLEVEAGDKASALAIALQAFNEDPLGEWAQETSRRLAAECGGWDKLVEAYEAALPRVRARSKDAKAVLPLLSTLAGAYESELGTPEAAIERNQAILAIAPSDPEAVGALERLYIATGRFPDLLAIYDKKLELAKSKSRGAGDPLQAREPLRRGDQAAREGDRALSGDPHPGRRAAAGADRARPHLHRPRPLERAGGDADQGDRPHHRHGRDRRAQVPARRAARAAPLRSQGRGRVVQGGAVARAGSRGREDRAAGVPQRSRSADGRRRGARADLRADRGHVAPGRGAAHSPQSGEEHRQARRAPAAHRRARGQARQLRAGVGSVRARVHREPRVDGRARGAGEPGGDPRQLGVAGDAVRGRARRQEGAAAAAGARAPAGRRRRLRREARRSRRRRSSTSAARRRSSPRTRRRWWRWSASTRAPSAGPI